MDYDNPQFISAVNKIVAKELIDRLDGIHESLQDLTKSITKATDANNQRQQTPPILRAELKVPHSKPYEQESKAAREAVTEHLKLWLEIVGILIVFAYTTLTFLQLEATKDAVIAANRSSKAAEDANRTIKEQFHIDERAWLAIAPDPIVFPKQDESDPRKLFSIGLNIKNTGKTPARDLRGWGRFQNIWSSNPGEKPPYFLKDKTRNDPPIDIPTLAPDGLAKITLQSPKAAIWPDRERNEDSYVNGEVRYCDVFNEEHFVNFCFEYRPSSNPPGITQFGGCIGAPRDRNSIDDINTHRKCL